MKKTKRGLFVHPDDMEVDMLIAVHSVKMDDKPASIFGVALKITAIQLPFVVAVPVAMPSQPPITLDVRYLNIMRISNEYARAQMANHETHLTGLPPEKSVAQ